MITNNYENGLLKELEQLTNLQNIAMVLGYEDDVIEVLNKGIAEVLQTLSKKHMEVTR